MSNIKRVGIGGELPFNATENDEFAIILGRLNAPSMGIKFEWGKVPCQYIPNENGGKTAFYEFYLTGEEAVSVPFLMVFITSVIAVGGKINNAYYYDIETCEGPFILYENGNKQ